MNAQTMGKLPLIAVVFTAFAGCTIIDDSNDHHSFQPGDTIVPAPPQGLVSITGDEQIWLEWLPNTEPDLLEYRVYWSPQADGVYELVGSTRTPSYVDRDVDNGETYYYAVTAVDDYENESELSREVVHDTPRPAGSNLVLWNAVGTEWQLSGFDFSDQMRRPFDSIATDVYFEFDGVRFAAVVADSDTDLQDAGYTELDALDWAPPEGWTVEDRVTLIEGHSYYVWTRDDHFAKFQVLSVSPDRVVLDWAYQLDKANPELIARGGR